MSRRPAASSKPAYGASRWLAVGAGLAGRQWREEWYGSPLHLLSLNGRRPEGVAAEPQDPRPADEARGRVILEGRWIFCGEDLEIGPFGDPWDRPSPSRAFAEALHRMDWLKDLLAAGEDGEREALRLVLEWRRVFGRWNAFSWAPAILERRVFNLATTLRRVCARASDAETAQLADALLRQARHLLRVAASPGRAAERAVCAALAGLTLDGQGGAELAEAASARLDEALSAAVLADGGHASRSPQAGVELLLDLLTLDDAFSKRGRPPPDEVSRAIDRLAAALRILTLPDGRLPRFQGGEAGRAADVAAARSASDVDGAGPPTAMPHTGYHRLDGRSLTVVVDTAAPAGGPWSEAACAQPAAIEVLSGTERLITNCGWSPVARGSHAFRLTGAGSTLTLEGASAGGPVDSLTAWSLGPRLTDAPETVERHVQSSPEATLIELAHDGWVPGFGLRHERVLYLDARADELRGEDRLTTIGEGRRRLGVQPVVLRFHLSPHVKASLARDGRSVLLQGASGAWWLRNDAAAVLIDGSVVFEDGEPLPTTQVVLRTAVAIGNEVLVRWKLAPVQVQKG